MRHSGAVAVHPGRDFNPRTPCGVRLPFFHGFPQRWKFQSTHPLRGATIARPLNFHVPIYFNPRTPCGVRRAAGRAAVTARRFQSTHPLRGATSCCRSHQIVAKFQSTHPLRGATYSSFFAISARIFQSTHPLRGATTSTPCKNRNYIISIHAPLAGCDRLGKNHTLPVPHFNPRTPCGV